MRSNYNCFFQIKNILNTIGTPIILSNLSITKLSLRKEEDIKEDQEQIINSIKNWKESWVSANYNEYINFYSPKAIYNNSEYRKWTRAKKNVFNKSKNIQISLNDISIYEYPSEKEELRLVIFNQDYRSNLIANKTKKKQIWKMENGKWKIIYEGVE